jgi:predicted nuclease with TOPRIM domain
MVSDQDRRDLYMALERQLGGGPAATMMELLPPVGWADVARQSDLVALRGEMAQLRGALTGEVAGVQGEFAELRGEFAELRGEFAELRGEFAEARGEFAELRGEVAELRGEVKAQLPKLIAANMGSMIGVAGLVLAAAKLA